VFNRLRKIFGSISTHIHSPTKIIISKVIDNVVVKKLSEYELIVHENFKQWYKQSIINVVIVCVVIVAGLLSYVFTDRTGLLKLAVAIAYLFSIVIFLYRRALNIKTFMENKETIISYSVLCINGLLKYPYGNKIKKTSYDVYLKIYNDNLSDKKQTIHTIASKLHVVPNNSEIFEILYVRFIEFYREIVLSSLVKFVSFVIAFAVLGFFVKNLVLLEMHFTNIFETILYPVLYFMNFLGKMA
jgi:hypothetical protein